MGVEREYAVGVHGKIWKCKCPQCGKAHKRRENYIGPAKTPPFFCQECRHNQEMHPVDYPEPYETMVQI